MAVHTLNSSRFGLLEVPEASVIEFPHGLIGLPGTRWTLLAHNDDSAFVWLHSLDDGELAIPVTNPWRFFADYEVALSDHETDDLGLTGDEETTVYVTVRAAAALEDFVANLAAPILVRAGKGYQVINQAPDSPVRAPLFAAAAAAAPAAA